MTLSDTIILTGATGYVGTRLAQRVLEEELYSIISITRHRHPLLAGSRNFEEVSSSALELPNPAGRKIVGIVHCAAMATPAACEKDPHGAYESNVALTRQVASLAKNLATHLVTVSTDLVFDGIKDVPDSGIPTDAKRCPRSVYARTKCEAEDITLEAAASYNVVRLSLVYGPRLPNRGTFLQWMEDRALRGERIPLFIDEWRTPTFVDDIVSSLLWCLRTRESGIFHCAGPQRLNRLQMAQALLPHYSQLFDPCYQADHATVPPRPRDVSLDNSRLAQLSGIKFRGPAEVAGLLMSSKN